MSIDLYLIYLLMVPILVCGGTKEERKKKLEKYLSDSDITEVDLLIVKGEKSIGIDEVKKTRKWAFLKPYESKIKAGVIWDAEKLTYQAQNALLKILEEPPEGCMFFLETEEEENLLATIRSRSKIVYLKKGDEEVVFSKEEIINYLNCILNGAVGEKFKLAEEIYKRKGDIERFTGALREVLREMVVGYYKGESFKLEETDVGEDDVEKMIEMIEKLDKMEYLYKRNVNLRLLLENYFL